MYRGIHRLIWAGTPRTCPGTANRHRAESGDRASGGAGEEPGTVQCPAVRARLRIRGRSSACGVVVCLPVRASTGSDGARRDLRGNAGVGRPVAGRTGRRAVEFLLGCRGCLWCRRFRTRGQRPEGRQRQAANNDRSKSYAHQHLGPRHIGSFHSGWVWRCLTSRPGRQHDVTRRGLPHDGDGPGARSENRAAWFNLKSGDASSVQHD